jgi:transcriptional regulator with GAF, ATPase, and Fis domain
VGDTRTQSADIRLICATHRELRAMVAEGTFRDDLFYRINIFPIRVPALRERREDIPALAFHFLRVRRRDREAGEVSDEALALLKHEWPNVRELETTMHRAVILATDRVIRKAHLASLVAPSTTAAPEVPRTGDELKRIKKAARVKSVEQIEKAFVLEALRRNAWNVTRSAEETGMQRANFQALMKKYDIHLRDAEKGPGVPDGS